MNRPNLRTAAVTAGFVAVGLVVAGTAAGMVGTPADAPVASAVQLTQEDPESLTPAIEAPDAGADPAAQAAAPVEVGSPAIQCSDEGVCERPSRVYAADGPDDRERRSSDEPAPATPPQQSVDCDRAHSPGHRSWVVDGGDWERALKEWTERWQAMAEQCGWHPGEWRTALEADQGGMHPWPDDDADREPDWHGEHDRGDSQDLGGSRSDADDVEHDQSNGSRDGDRREPPGRGHR